MIIFIIVYIVLIYPSYQAIKFYQSCSDASKKWLKYFVGIFIIGMYAINTVFMIQDTIQYGLRFL